VISGDKHQTAAEVAAAAAAAEPKPAEIVTYHKAETNGGFTSAGDMWISSKGTEQNTDPLVNGQTLTLADGNFNVQNSKVIVPQGTYTVMTFNNNTIKALKSSTDGKMYYLTMPSYSAPGSDGPTFSSQPINSYDDKTGVSTTLPESDGSVVVVDSKGTAVRKMKDGTMFQFSKQRDGNPYGKLFYTETKDADGKVIFTPGYANYGH
jgi:hypothetical protein